MFDAIAASTLGAAGFFLPDINQVRKDAPDSHEVDDDLKFGVAAALGFSFLIAAAVANSQGQEAYLYWLAIVSVIGGAYFYAYRMG